MCSMWWSVHCIPAVVTQSRLVFTNPQKSIQFTWTYNARTQSEVLRRKTAQSESSVYPEQFRLGPRVIRQLEAMYTSCNIILSGAFDRPIHNRRNSHVQISPPYRDQVSGRGVFPRGRLLH